VHVKDRGLPEREASKTPTRDIRCRFLLSSVNKEIRAENDNKGRKSHTVVTLLRITHRIIPNMNFTHTK
jgi:hypothetical protein